MGRHSCRPRKTDWIIGVNPSAAGMPPLLLTTKGVDIKEQIPIDVCTSGGGRLCPVYVQWHSMSFWFMFRDGRHNTTWRSSRDICHEWTWHLSRANVTFVTHERDICHEETWQLSRDNCFLVLSLVCSMLSSPLLGWRSTTSVAFLTEMMWRRQCL